MKRIRVINPSELPVNMPLHWSLTIYLAITVLQGKMAVIPHTVISTILVIFGLLLWVSWVVRHFLVEEPVSLLNEE